MTAPLPTLAAASAAIADGSLSPVELVDSALARIAELDHTLHAFVRVTSERARKAAADAAEEIAAGRRRGPLHGIPYALKDLYDVRGLPTTAQSKLLLDNVARQHAAAVERLEDAGMILLGKLNLHEFALGAPTWETPFPPACNPWDTRRFAGGSSSGSAVALAAGMVPLTLGTDTGGSIRMPAAFCGVVGLKPTYGLISRHGIVPLSYTVDHAGPLARTVEDCALALQVLAGYDPRDPASADVPVPDFGARLDDGVAGLCIGFARGFNEEAGVDEDEEAALATAAATLSSLGADVVEVILPSVERLAACLWTLHHAEAFAVHQDDLRHRPDDYARVTRERLLMGAFVSGPQYVQAQRLRRVLAAEVDAVLERCDVVMTAPVSGPAVLLDEVDDGPWRVRQPVTAGFNATGHPALCVPCGFSADGLPLSMQLVGRAFDEATLFRVGHAYQQATDWHLRRPNLTGPNVSAGEG